MFKLIVIIVLAHGTSQHEYEFSTASKCQSAMAYYNGKLYREHLASNVGSVVFVNINANCWEK